MALVGLIERGEPLDDFQSKRPAKTGYFDRSEKVGAAAKGMAWRNDRNIQWDRDSVLNAYGLHHLHIRRGGSQELTYIQFGRESAHFVYFGTHDDFHSEALGEAVARDGLARGRALIGIRPPRGGHEFSAGDQQEIEQAGMSTFRVVDGAVVPTASQTLAGTSLRTEHYARRIWRKINAFDPLISSREFVSAFFGVDGDNIPKATDFFHSFNDLDLWLGDRVSDYRRPILEAPL